MSDALSQVASQLTNRPLSRLAIMGTITGCELFLASLGLWIAAFATTPPAEFDPVSALYKAMLGASLLVSFFAVAGAYHPHALRSLRRSVRWCLAEAAVLAVIGVLVGLSDVSVTQWAGAITFTFLPLALSLRLLACRFVRWATSFGALERRAIIAGGGARAARVIEGLSENPDNDIRVVAMFDDRDDVRSPPQILGVPKIGGFADVMRFVARAEFDVVLITLPLEAEDRIKWLLAKFKPLPHKIHLVEFAKDRAVKGAEDVRLPMVRDASFGAARRYLKRSFDLFFGSLAVIVTAPIMLLAAAAIRLDSPGPIFFTQWRHGFSNRKIPILKFRSMYHDRASADGSDVVKIGGDPRVTRVGAILRKTSIDELPQLFCVLKGDLSLVGPRPHAIDARSSKKEPFTDLVDDYASRHRLPPGITGWAQINGLRGGIVEPEQLRDRVAHDLHYIENWSMIFDVKILLRTPLALFKTQNAY